MAGLRGGADISIDQFKLRGETNVYNLNNELNDIIRTTRYSRKGDTLTVSFKTDNGKIINLELNDEENKDHLDKCFDDYNLLCETLKQIVNEKEDWNNADRVKLGRAIAKLTDDNKKNMFLYDGHKKEDLKTLHPKLIRAILKIFNVTLEKKDGQMVPVTFESWKTGPVYRELRTYLNDNVSNLYKTMIDNVNKVNNSAETANVAVANANDAVNAATAALAKIDEVIAAGGAGAAAAAVAAAVAATAAKPDATTNKNLVDTEKGKAVTEKGKAEDEKGKADAAKTAAETAYNDNDEVKFREEIQKISAAVTAAETAVTAAETAASEANNKAKLVEAAAQQFGYIPVIKGGRFSRLRGGYFAPLSNEQFHKVCQFIYMLIEFVRANPAILKENKNVTLEQFKRSDVTNFGVTDDTLKGFPIFQVTARASSNILPEPSIYSGLPQRGGNVFIPDVSNVNVHSLYNMRQSGGEKFDVTKFFNDNDFTSKPSAVYLNIENQIKNSLSRLNSSGVEFDQVYNEKIAKLLKDFYNAEVNLEKTYKKMNKFFELARKDGLKDSNISENKFEELYNKLNAKYMSIIDKRDSYTVNCNTVLQKFNEILSSHQFARPAGQEIEI